MRMWPKQRIAPLGQTERGHTQAGLVEGLVTARNIHCVSRLGLRLRIGS